MFDRFDLLIERTSCNYSDSVPESIDGLMMDRVDPESLARIELPEERIFLFYRDLIDLLISSLWLEVIRIFFDILFERSSVIDIEKLHPFTDSEEWFFGLCDFPHRVHEISIIARDRTSCSLHISAIKRWIDIRSSGKYESITHLYIGICMRRKTGDDNRHISCLFDLGDVVKSEIIKESSRIFSSLSKNTNFFHDFLRVILAMWSIFLGIFATGITSFTTTITQLYHDFYAMIGEEGRELGFE